MNPARGIVGGLTLAAVSAALAGGPFVHVHGVSDTAHGPSSSVVVHSHFPSAASHRPSEEPEFHAPRHDGRGLDLFVSSEGRALAAVAGAEREWVGAPSPEAGGASGPVRFDRTHDPPIDAVSSRAPPLQVPPFD